jgi:hypothetical protein
MIPFPRDRFAIREYAMARKSLKARRISAPAECGFHSAAAEFAS